nr:2920_t:CDS:2 [Entrophospora candida]
MLVDEEQDNIREQDNIYDQVPFTVAAEELLKAIKENLVKELVFLTHYNRRRFPGGDKRKEKKMKDTFGSRPEAKMRSSFSSDFGGNYINNLLTDEEEKIWLITGLTTLCGITSDTTKLVPIPSHKLGEIEIVKDNTVVTTGEFQISFFRVTHSIPGAFGLIIEVIRDNTRIVITVEGNTPSETKVIKRLENIITEATGRVIITSFASNVYRLKKAEAIAKTPNNKLVIFCTGSQGEERAVLSRLAHQVEKVNNKLFALGAKIYENSKEDLLHASGHACQEDLKLMLKLVNPRYFMPFHGDFRMLKRHGFLAQELGLPEKNVFVCENGEIVEAKGKDFFLSEARVPSQPNYVLNGKLLPTGELNNSLLLREKMSQGGVVLIVLFYDKKNKKLSDSPYIFTYGFINMKRNEELISS